MEGIYEEMLISGEFSRLRFHFHIYCWMVYFAYLFIVALVQIFEDGHTVPWVFSELVG